MQTALKEAKAHPKREEELMSVARLEHIPGFDIGRVAAAVGDDPDVLPMENLDTDISPSEEAMKATRAASLFR